MISTYGQIESLDDFTRQHDRLALGVCQSLVRFYELLNSEAQHLSAAGKAEFVRIGNQLPQMYGQLARASFDRGLRLWKLSPKFHQFMELCLFGISMGNPCFIGVMEMRT